MPQFNINAIELTRQVFNLPSYSLPSLSGRANRGDGVYEEIETFDEASVVHKGFFGTPVFDVIAFKGSIGQGKDGYNLPEFTINDAPLVTIYQNNVILKTPVRGRRGTVKEWLGQSDFRVNVKCLLVNHTSNEPPYDRIADFEEFLTAPIAHRIASGSRLMQIFGIDYLVVESFHFSEPTHLNVQPLEINFLSDLSVELEEVGNV